MQSGLCQVAHFRLVQTVSVVTSMQTVGCGSTVRFLVYMSFLIGGFTVPQDLSKGPALASRQPYNHWKLQVLRMTRPAQAEVR